MKYTHTNGIKPQKGRHATAFLNFSGNLNSLARRKILREVAVLSAKNGCGAYLVGGAVRNCVLSIGLEPDFDFAIKGEAVALGAALAKKLGGAAFALDKELGACRVAIKGRSKVSVIDLIPLNGKDILEDLSKRDFTVNAMAVDLARIGKKNKIELIDPFNGLDDARAGLLRLVSPGAVDEDPMRCMRAVRLARQYGFKMHEGTFEEVRSKAVLLTNVSVERIRDEFTVICSLPDAAGSLSDLFDAGIATVIFPELRSWTDSPAYDILGHTLKTIAALKETIDDLLGKASGKYADKIARHINSRIAGSGSMKRSTLLTIAAFLHDSGKLPKMTRIEGRLRFIGHDLEGSLMAGEMVRRLRFSSAAAMEVARLVRNHHRLFDLARLENRTDRSRAHFFRALGGPAGIDLIILALSDARATRGKADAGLELVAKEMIGFYYTVYARRRPRPLFTGVQVMRTFGVKPGKVVGEILAMIAAGIESGEVTTREEAVEYVRAKMYEY